MKNETKITADPGKQELFIERAFDAPRELVFRAFMEPKLVEQWLGPKELVCKVETHAEGNKYVFSGVVHEITAPERVIRTFEFEGLPERGHVSLEVLTLESLPGNRTKITAQSVFRSVADRDGMIQSGMERGVLDSHERLDNILNQLQSSS